MKLKKGYIVQNIDDTQFLVSSDAESFSGILRNNETAAFIVNCLKKETTEDEIIEAVWQTYDAPREQIKGDVREVLEVLRGIRALD